MKFCFPGMDKIVSFMASGVPQRSPIWNFYILEYDNVRCRACGLLLKGLRASNAEKHLILKHPHETKLFRREKKRWLHLKRVYGYTKM